LDDAIDYAPSPGSDASLDYSRGVSGHEAIRRHVVHDDAPYFHDALVSNFDAREDKTAHRNVTIFPNSSIHTNLTQVVVSKNSHSGMHDCTLAYMNTFLVPNTEFCGKRYNAIASDIHAQKPVEIEATKSK
jgi:hypothetical protein